MLVLANEIGLPCQEIYRYAFKPKLALNYQGVDLTIKKANLQLNLLVSFQLGGLGNKVTLRAIYLQCLQNIKFFLGFYCLGNHEDI